MAAGLLRAAGGIGWKELTVLHLVGFAWEISQFWQFRQRKLQPAAASENAVDRGAKW
jgi:hypothetical protein